VRPGGVDGAFIHLLLLSFVWFPLLGIDYGDGVFGQTLRALCAAQS
jgi:hypothetical protein